MPGWRAVDAAYMPAVIAHPGVKLVDHPSLADASLAHDENRPSVACGGCAAGGLQASQRTFTADQAGRGMSAHVRPIGQLANEPVTAANPGFDEAGGLGIVPQQAANGSDVRLDDLRLHEFTGPDGIQQFVRLEDAARLISQVCQQPEHFGWHLDGTVVPPQRLIRPVDGKARLAGSSGMPGGHCDPDQLNTVERTTILFSTTRLLDC